MTDAEFRARLEAASRALDAQKDAPQWLKDTVRASVRDAAALAPAETQKDAPGDFYYPH